MLQDPEFPQTLEELNVIEEDFIKIDPIGKDEYNIKIEFKPTVPHCSLATLIGESVKYIHMYVGVVYSSILIADEPEVCFKKSAILTVLSVLNSFTCELNGRKFLRVSVKLLNLTFLTKVIKRSRMYTFGHCHDTCSTYM